MKFTWCSTESMAALCEWAFVEPEDRGVFLIKSGIMHVVRETETRERRHSGGRRGLEEWAACCLLNLCLGFEFHSQGNARIASGREEEAPAGNPKNTWVDRKVKVSYLEIMLLTIMHLEFYGILQYTIYITAILVLKTFREGILNFISQSNNSSRIWELLACTMPCMRY